MAWRQPTKARSIVGYCSPVNTLRPKEKHALRQKNKKSGKGHNSGGENCATACPEAEWKKERSRQPLRNNPKRTALCVP